MAENSKKLEPSSVYLFILFIVPLFFYTGALDVFNAPKVWVLSGLTSGLMVMHLFSRSKRVKEELVPRGQRILVALIISLVILMAITSFLTETTLARILWGYPGRANGLIFYYSVFVIVVVAMRMRLKHNFIPRLNITLTAVFLINATYGIIQFLNLDPIPFNRMYNPIIGTFGNPNFSSSFLGAGSIFLLMQGMRQRGISRIFYIGSAIFSCTIVVLSESIQGLILVILGLAMLGLKFLKQRFNFRLFFASLLSLGLIGLFFLYSFLGMGPLGAQLYQYTLKLRLDYWLIGINSGLANLWTGLGPDSYIEGFLKHRSREFVDTYGVGLRNDSAHNTLINFFANFGLLSFLLMLALVLWISIKSISLFLNSNVESPMQSEIAMLWCLLFVQSLISIEQPGLGSFQWCLGALVLNRYFRSERRQDSDLRISTSGRRTSVKEFKGEITLITVILILFANSKVLQEENRIKRIVFGQSTQASTKPVTQELEQFSFLTRNEYRRVYRLVDYLINAGEIQSAFELTQEIVSADPEDVEALEQLARFYRYFNRASDEVEVRSKIEELNPLDSVNVLKLIEALALDGNQEEAKSLANRLTDLWPNTAEAETATLIVKGFDSNE